MSAGAGVSSRLAMGQWVPPSTKVEATASTRVAEIVASAVGPNEVAPWLNLRVGTGAGTDLDLAYTGQGFRLGGRWATWTSRLTLSLGAGVSARIPSLAGQGGAAVDTSDLTGYGLDLPVVIGWRSKQEVVQLWLGGRAAFRRASGSVVFSEAEGTERGEVAADLWTAGPLLGLAVGFYPLWIGFELAADFGWGNGTLSVEDQHTEARLSGWALTPAGALLFVF